MNEIVNKFLLDSDKFMPEMHLKQPGFTYSARGPFTENKERRTASDKILRDKAFSIAKNPKYDGYRRGLASRFIKFLIKRRKGAVLTYK